MSISIERITPRWYEQKALVQSTTWRETNEGSIPQSIIEAITPQFALELTEQQSQDQNQISLIALQIDSHRSSQLPADEAHVIGFAEILRTPRSPIRRSDVAELGSLYVLKEHQHQGVGRALVETAMLTLKNPKLKNPKLALWVFASNDNAIGFYRHMGFHLTGNTQVEDAGRELEMTNYLMPGSHLEKPEEPA